MGKSMTCPPYEVLGPKLLKKVIREQLFTYGHRNEDLQMRNRCLRRIGAEE